MRTKLNMVNNMWAPWRMEFIDDQRFKDGKAPCVFCELGAVAQLNSENLVLTKGKECFVVMNRFPYTNGHLLVVPYKHTAKMQDLSASAYQEMMTLMTQGMDVLAKGVGAEGFNCGLNLGRVAGAGIVDHLHWHVVPRWNGDTNFFPVLGDARSMPEYLAQTYQRIAKDF